MFQTYEPVSDISYAKKHLPLLREKLIAQNLTGFVIPHDDEYQNEYIPEYAERLLWATGFSGSAGSAVVMHDRATIFVDGRYTLQVRQQVDDSYFTFEDSSEVSAAKWLTKNASGTDRIGYDPMLHTSGGVKTLEKAAKKAGFSLIAVIANPIDDAWSNQPERPMAPIRSHGMNFAGESSQSKRSKIAESLKEAGADAALITAPPSLAWLFNIRGQDVARSPLPLGRALIHSDGTAKLFIAPEKSDNQLPAHLGDDVSVYPEAGLDAALQEIGKNAQTIAIDPTLAPAKFSQDLIQSGAKVVDMVDPCALPRACKNEVEQEGARNAHIRDGASVTEFLYWIANSAQEGSVDEITAAKKLEEYRRKNDDLADISFDSISAAGSNGAHCHYKVSTETNKKLAVGTLYLIDSGGQYPDGTTDITRTVPIGTPTAEMRDRFTRVLKGHIALATMHFPKGTSGEQLDAFARKPLWDMGLDFDHGTGHGVGSFLGVHEGPQRIAKVGSGQALHPGMIISNEPGFYKAGEFGIRIENLVIVTTPQTIDGGERAMMGFETITLAPINLDLIDVSILTDSERLWLNAYHVRVLETLSPMLTDDVVSWLKTQTKPV